MFLKSFCLLVFKIFIFGGCGPGIIVYLPLSKDKISLWKTKFIGGMVLNSSGSPRLPIACALCSARTTRKFTDHPRVSL